MRHKILALFFSFVLIMTTTLPGTWAVSTDVDDSSTSQTTAVSCTCGTEEDVHGEGCPLWAADGVDFPSDEVSDKDKEGSEGAEAKPEGMPPESLGSMSLEGAVSFTNVAPLVQFDSPATLELYDTDLLAEANNGVVLDKFVTAGEDDKGPFYTITLEAYATGAQTTISRYEPTDIVLVLDTSGSMKYGMSADDYEDVYIGNTDRPAQYESYMILRDGEYVVVMYNNGKWYIVNDDNTWGDRVNPKTSQWDSQNVQFLKVKTGQSKMDYLKQGVNTFIESALETSQQSQIAVVSFSGKVDGNDPPKASTVSGFSNDSSALQTAVNNLSARGATYSSEGMKRAAELLQGRENNGHKKVVIMFTDGAPSEKIAFSDAVANGAIQASYGLKQSGVTVYTIGVFAGADGSLSSVNKDDTNKYMHYVSSNYPSAQSLTDGGNPDEDLEGNSYYLSAGNNVALQDIFKKISEQVGGATNTTLGSSTIVKDIVAPSFTVPTDASDIKFYTEDCSGVAADGKLTFRNRLTAAGVTASINEENATLDTTGFDFSANWCGPQDGVYRGKKLIIEFKVRPKDGFLGGNNVDTNGAESGIYDAKGNLVAYFPKPEANVTIKNNDTTITSNVYLGGYYGQTLTGEQIKGNTKITIGGVELDLSKGDYGLAAWQTEYVDISVTITDKNGNVYIASTLTDDLDYTVTVTIKPKEGATGANAVGKPNDMGGQNSKLTNTIHVFKPELTYQDSKVWYGDDAPTSYDGNLKSIRWVHYGADGVIDKEDEDVKMMGTAPELGITYTPESGKIVDGKIATKQDIAVDVTVKIGDWNVTDYIKFLHTPCTDGDAVPENGKFWLHVETCQLTITKTGGASDEPYVFEVYRGDTKYTEVSIWGNGSVTIYDLPVGIYRIQEDSGWSWRYNPTYEAGDTVTLNAKNPSGSITCKNTSNTNKWLNGFSTIVENIFGESKIKESN